MAATVPSPIVNRPTAHDVHVAVYWAKQGRISVDLGIGAIAAGGTSFASIPLVRRILGNRR